MKKKLILAVLFNLHLYCDTTIPRENTLKIAQDCYKENQIPEGVICSTDPSGKIKFSIDTTKISSAGSSKIDPTKIVKTDYLPDCAKFKECFENKYKSEVSKMIQLRLKENKFCAKKCEAEFNAFNASKTNESENAYKACCRQTTQITKQDLEYFMRFNTRYL